MSWMLGNVYKTQEHRGSHHLNRKISMWSHNNRGYYRNLWLLPAELPLFQASVKILNHTLLRNMHTYSRTYANFSFGNWNYQLNNSTFVLKFDTVGYHFGLRVLFDCIDAHGGQLSGALHSNLYHHYFFCYVDIIKYFCN